MVRSLALYPDDAYQDPMVYGAEFGVVFPAEGPRIACIQEDPDCLDPYHWGLEGERYFRFVVELTLCAIYGVFLHDIIMQLIIRYHH